MRTKSTKTVSGEVIPGKSVWLDASHTLFVHKTLQISLSVSIALYEFTYNDQSTLKAFEGHGEQYPLPPRTFWDGPNLKAALHIDYGAPKEHHSWVCRNWAAVKKLIDESEYPYASSHFWVSYKSREAQRTGQGLKPAQKAKLEDIGPSVIEGNCMENYCFSTLGVIFGLLQWNRILLTDKARDHCPEVYVACQFVDHGCELHGFHHGSIAYYWCGCRGHWHDDIGLHWIG